MDAMPAAAFARATAICPSGANSASPPNGAVSTGTDSGMPRNSVFVLGSLTPVIGRGLITQRENASRLARSVCSVPAPLSRYVAASCGRRLSAAAWMSARVGNSASRGCTGVAVAVTKRTLSGLAGRAGHGRYGRSTHSFCGILFLIFLVSGLARGENDSPGDIRADNVARDVVEVRVSCSALVPDVTPLRGPGSAGFRAMFTSRTVAYLGSQAAEVALLVQAQRITGSPLVVGTLGLAELVPLIVFGLYGGVLADRFDRRALMRWSEPGLAACAALLLLNALLPHPLLWPLYVIAGLMMALASLQRPAFEAATPRLVGRDQMTAASAILSLTVNASILVGSSLGGVLAVS